MGRRRFFPGGKRTAAAVAGEASRCRARPFQTAPRGVRFGRIGRISRIGPIGQIGRSEVGYGFASVLMNASKASACWAMVFSGP